jgi:hypothetical protein
MRQIVEDSLIIYKNRKDGEKLKLVPELVAEAQGSFDFTELVSFDETLSPDALGDDGDDGGVVEAREAPGMTARTSAPKPNVRQSPDAAGSRVANQPPVRKATRGIPNSSEKSKRGGIFDRFRRR